MKKPDIQNPVRFLPLIGFLLVICLYFVIHKPFDDGIVFKAGTNIVILLLDFAFCAMAGGTGRWILDQLHFKNQPSIIYFAFGLGCLSVIFLLIGSIIGVHTWWVWMVFILISIFLFRHIWEWVRKISFEIIHTWQQSTRFGKALGWISMIIVFCALIIAFAPPLKFDALVYHLALPKIYIESGSLAFQPDNMFWGMPQLGEMLYTWMMLLAGDRAAVCLGYMVGVICLGGLLHFSSRKFNTSVGWVAISALLSGNTFSASLSWGYIDWFTILYGISVMISLDQWIETRLTKDLILSGVMAGFCLGCKYTAGVIVLAAMVVIGWQCFDELRPGKSNNNFFRVIRLIMIFGLAVIIITVPWWLRNYFATGNPFYPFFFATASMDSFRLSFYQIPISTSLWETILLPFSATFLGVEGATGFSASIGPLLLGLGLFAWLPKPAITRTQELTFRLCLLLTLSGIVIWMVGSRFSEYLIQSRMYFSIFPALAIISGLGFLGLSQLHPFGIRMQNVIGALIILCLSFTALEVSRQVVKTRSLSLIANHISEDEYLGENLGWYYPAVNEISKLNRQRKVLLLFEPRGYFCLPNCDPDEILDQWKHDLFLFENPSGVLNAWKEQGFTDVMFNRFGAEFVKESDSRYQSKDWEMLEELLAGLSEPVNFGEAYFRYSLTP